MAQRLSLIGRALRLLARREHSRFELHRKLAGHAQTAQELVGVLDQLEQRDLLSAERFAESVVHRRADRFGQRRIAQELQQHRVDDLIAAPLLEGLRASERERAMAVWRKRFDALPVDARERARQHRFLAQRGFGGDTIAWVFRAGSRGNRGSQD